MSYTNYSAADFALDNNFQKWVLSPDEQTVQFWNDWLSKNPQKQKDVDEARELLRLAGLTIDAEANAAFLETWERVKANASRELDRQYRSSYRKYVALAAVLAAALVVAVVYLVILSAELPSARYSTAYGEVKDFVLPDGSTVTLNANSTLVCTGDWKKQREVALTGEAFFEVKKTPDHKSFIVKANEDLAVQVLGTEFNVNARRSTVYLQSGKVALTAASASSILEPGDLAEVDNTQHQIHVTHEATGTAIRELAWRNNFFQYDDTPLASIAVDLRENFGMEVIIKDPSLNRKRLTAKIPRKDVKVMLEILAQSLEVNITQNNNQVVISPSGND